MDTHPAVKKAIELQPLIRENLVAGEERARLMPSVVKAVGEAGLFRLYAPHEVGGLEAPPSVFVAAEEAVSTADPAVAWYMVNSLPACHIAASLGESEREELFAEPDRHFGFSGVPGARAVPVEGGYRVSGKWPLVTGCEDSAWCALGGVVYDGDSPRLIDGAPDGRVFMIRTENLDVSPTWQEAAAMRGTASNAASLDEIFVPEGMAHSAHDGLTLNRPNFRVPLWSLFAAADAAIANGVLFSAVEAAREELSTKISSYRGTPLRDDVPIQELIAHCRATYVAVRAGILQLTDELGEAANTGEPIPEALRSDLFCMFYFALDTTRESVSRLYARGTRAGFLRGNTVERALRNLHAIAFGCEGARPLQHDAGRILMGGSPTHPAF